MFERNHLPSRTKYLENEIGKNMSSINGNVSGPSLAHTGLGPRTIDPWPSLQVIGPS